MRNIATIGLCLLLSLVLTAPAFGQRGENNDYQAIQDQQSPQVRKQLIEQFLSSYPNSQYRPDLDNKLMDLYAGNREWGPMLLKAEQFRLQVPTADAKSRASFYTRAMVAATQVNNLEKTIEFGDRVIEAEPGNFSALLTLAGLLSDRLPQDAAARTTALNKAQGYAEKAKNAPRGTLNDADWQRTQTRVHSILGGIYFVKGQLPEAGVEYTESLKIDPKNGMMHFRMGAIYVTQIQTRIPALQAAIKAADDAAAAKADAKQLDELLAKRSAAEKAVVESRDAAIESLAKAVALGGDFAAPARQQLEALYKNKTGSVDTLEQFISQKKTELGL